MNAHTHTYTFKNSRRVSWSLRGQGQGQGLVNQFMCMQVEWFIYICIYVNVFVGNVGGRVSQLFNALPTNVTLLLHPQTLTPTQIQRRPGNLI